MLNYGRSLLPFYTQPKFCFGALRATNATHIPSRVIHTSHNRTVDGRLDPRSAARTMHAPLLLELSTLARPQAADCSHTHCCVISPLTACPLDLTSRPQPCKPPCLSRAASREHLTFTVLRNFCSDCTFTVLRQKPLTFTVPPPYERNHKREARPEYSVLKIVVLVASQIYTYEINEI